MENKEYYKKLFPLLTDYELIPNSESEDYNCISYTIGRTDVSSFPLDDNTDYWPVKNEKTKQAFDEFYEFHGFEKMNLLDFFYDPKYIKVALYVNNGIPTHGAIQVDEFFWESKIGSLGVIKHDLFEIEDDVYGKVTQIYKKPKPINESIILKYYQFIKNKIKI
jgi:hypothetical protein